MEEGRGIEGRREGVRKRKRQGKGNEERTGVLHYHVNICFHTRRNRQYLPTVYSLPIMVLLLLPINYTEPIQY